ncbi:endo alpha-1,4 polygalactosaminidase [Streptomyces sp. UNOB3_S3]|uniref:endo alpha-1,4 polygalactosaminidase n=1 Tax=Streptomyces sp. UNOB3_S3 TaxID=2871682 RepID=UPI001E320871|nr:endo alpha-1,4 polygalactosaminidase [Streptomyces sp. UNOB3_S3]MCC3779608.1 endo alpha-1,4 polygalactosaminidase [Streptomyces sp. UNOB3_S3]
MSAWRVRAGLCAALLLVLAGCSASPADDDGPDRDDDGVTAAPRASGAPRSPGAPEASGTPGAAASPGGSATGSPPAASRWQPRPGTGWQWQLDGKADTSVDAPVYDIDGFENSAETVAQLHSRGRKVICYINAGAWEDFRPDQGKFPKNLLGNKNKGWKGEKWFDIRRLDTLRPLMAARMDMCRQKGFDAVEPDLTEGFRNATGFPLTADHQLAFNRMLADLAHERGLAIGLKNDLDQIPQLADVFDFAVNEQCAQYDECEKLTPFVKRDKAVFHVEYELSPGEFCPTARRLGLSSMKKKLELDTWRQPC